MRKMISWLAALCLVAVPVLASAEVASLQELNFGIEAPAGMSVFRDEGTDEGVGLIQFGTDADAPVQYTFRSAPLPEGQEGDLAAMDDAGRAAFAEAILGAYDDAEVTAVTTSSDEDAVQLTADEGRLFALIWVRGGRSLACYAASTGDALTDADIAIVEVMPQSANG